MKITIELSQWDAIIAAATKTLRRLPRNETRTHPSYAVSTVTSIKGALK
jgi:hypothetical protein